MSICYHGEQKDQDFQSFETVLHQIQQIQTLAKTILRSLWGFLSKGFMYLLLFQAQHNHFSNLVFGIQLLKNYQNYLGNLFYLKDGDLAHALCPTCTAFTICLRHCVFIGGITDGPQQGLHNLNRRDKGPTTWNYQRGNHL